MTKDVIPESPEMADASAELERALIEIFEAAAQGPLIERIHHADWCEDNRTFVVMCDAPGGGTIMWTFEDGERVTTRYL